MRIEASELKDKLYELLGKIMFGEEERILITKDGSPVAVLADYYSVPQKIKLGVAKGKFVIPDDWDSKETNEEIAELFGVK